MRTDCITVRANWLLLLLWLNYSTTWSIATNYANIVGVMLYGDIYIRWIRADVSMIIKNSDQIPILYL